MTSTTNPKGTTMTVSMIKTPAATQLSAENLLEGFDIGYSIELNAHDEDRYDETNSPLVRVFREN